MDSNDPILAEAAVVEIELGKDVRVNYRAWFYPFLVAFGAMVLMAWQPTEVYGPLPQLAVLLAYVSLACTFCPWPTAWVVMLWSAPVAGGGFGIAPLVVATVATVGTCIANMHDYYIVTFLYRFRPVRKIRRTRWYDRAARWFDRAPFATLTAASFLPIPIDVVRLLAISQGYSRTKFVIASGIGRWPRYLALAVFAEKFDLGWQWILAVLGATVIIGLWGGLPRLIRGLKGMGAKEATS
jgi:membrane protein YqaA with SNARE-associated domain